MVNQVYLLPKTGIGAVNPSTQPSVMQVRSIATGLSISNPPNGIPGGISILPRSTATVTAGYAPSGVGVSGSGKLSSFLIQLLELSKNNKDTHSTVVHLIQALVNSELDTNTFCTQLRANLRSANTTMDIVPFVKENIDALRRDMISGVCRIPNILAPPSQMSIEAPYSNSSVPVLPLSGMGTLVVSNSNAVLSAVPSTTPTSLVSFPSTPTLLSSGLTTRLAVPASNLACTQPRIIGSLITPTGNTPNLIAAGVSTAAPAVVATPLTTANRLQTVHSHHPILAPAPPRVQSISSATLTATPASGTGLTRYRFPQTAGTVMVAPQVNVAGVHSSIVSATSETYNVSTATNTRLTSAAAAASARAGSLRPLTATPIPVAPSPNRPVAPVLTSPLIRSKPATVVATSYSGAQHNSTTPGTTLTAALVNGGSGIPRAQLVTASTLPSALDKLASADDSCSLVSIASSSSDRVFFPTEHIRSVIAGHSSISSLVLSDEALLCLSHGLQTFTRNVLTRLSLVVSHRLDRLGDDPRLVQVDHAREQLKFLQKLDERDRVRQSELEKDLILKAAKSRSRNEDPDQMRMREMARRIASEDYEREKQHQANLTALHAIGPQRKRRFDLVDEPSSTTIITAASSACPSESSLLSGALIQRDLPANILQNRISVSTPGIGRSTLITGSSTSLVPHLAAESTNLTALTTGGQSGESGCGDLTGSSTNLLSHTSRRVYVASVRDLQLVLSRSQRLRRTRAYYRTHWRS